VQANIKQVNSLILISSSPYSDSSNTINDLLRSLEFNPESASLTNKLDLKEDEAEAQIS
jgi:hypothetical protein